MPKIISFDDIPATAPDNGKFVSDTTKLLAEISTLGKQTRKLTGKIEEENYATANMYSLQITLAEECEKSRRLAAAVAPFLTDQKVRSAVEREIVRGKDANASSILRSTVLP